MRVSTGRAGGAGDALPMPGGGDKPSSPLTILTTQHSHTPAKARASAELMCFAAPPCSCQAKIHQGLPGFMGGGAGGGAVSTQEPRHLVLLKILRSKGPGV